MNFLKSSSWIIFLVLFVFRLVSVFEIFPENAPDERGHMTIVTGLSQGRLLTLSESLAYSHYPYAIYNPTPYLPYALGLKVASLFDPQLIEMEMPAQNFHVDAVRAARLGGLFWFALFAIFFLKLIQDFSLRDQLLLSSLIGLLPQLTFVQSYVNLDSMGVGVALYLVWATLERRWKNVAFAIFLVLTSKLNFFCLLVFPVWIFVTDYRKNLKKLLILGIQTFAVPAVVGSFWFIYNYFVNTRSYNSFLGFSALNQIYQVQPGGWRVLHPSFLSIALRSGFGLFGWMDQPLHPFFTWIWRLLLFPIGTLSLLSSVISKKERGSSKILHQAFFLVFLLNWFIFYFASFTGEYQPQGRYLFPAYLICMAYLVYAIFRMEKQSSSKKRALEWITYGLFCLMGSAAVLGLIESAKISVGRMLALLK